MVKVTKHNCMGSTSAQCHDALLLLNPNLIQVCHLKTGDHILLFASDYDLKGSLKEPKINDLAWSMGLVTKYDKDDKIITPPDLVKLKNDLKL